MKYIRLIATFLIIIFIAHLLDEIYVRMLKKFADELTGIASVGYLLLVGLPRIVIGWAMGSNIGRLSNWIWNKTEWN